MKGDNMTILTDQVHQEVRSHYSRIVDERLAFSSVSCCSGEAGASCCESEQLYEADTTWLPEDVTGLSLGCGDPITLAQLEPGQTVLDLGSGAGIDCFMAARQVGPSGWVIGVDMTPAMLAKANRNKELVSLDNVEFRHGQIESLPVDNEVVDVIISNCVVNLSPDKPAVFREAFRVLKPGGRLAISDIVTRGAFTPQQRADMAAWSACITGADDVVEIVAALSTAGFTGISVRDKGNPQVELAGSLPMSGPASVFSATISAVKPEHENGNG
jgi:SAM-dependent methyltransferase